MPQGSNWIGCGGFDGFTFYYSGFLRAQEEYDKKNIENMAKGSRKCDVAFLLFSAGGKDADYIDQLISILKLKVVFLHMALRKPHREVIETLREKYPQVKFGWARDPGERFYHKGKLIQYDLSLFFGERDELSRSGNPLCWKERLNRFIEFFERYIRH